MKTLILVRHAKSDKTDPSLRDFDRPLGQNGERDALVVAERVAALGLRVNMLISSPAVRALSTAEAFAEKLSLPVKPDGRIYEAGVKQLLAVVHGIDDRHSTAVLIGHNPGLSEFLRYLTDENFADLPASGVAVINLPLKSWKHTFDGKGILKNSTTLNDEYFGIRSGVPVHGWRERYRIWQFEHAKHIYLTTFFVIALLIVLGVVGLTMHMSTNSSAMPQQGSKR
jgi:phosphohistidine phosphatase